MFSILLYGNQHESTYIVHCSDKILKWECSCRLSCPGLWLQIEDRRKKQEVERSKKLKELWSREIEIRGLLEKNKAEKMNEIKHCEEEAKKLKEEISMEKRNLE